MQLQKLPARQLLPCNVASIDGCYCIGLDIFLEELPRREEQLKEMDGWIERYGASE